MTFVIAYAKSIGANIESISIGSAIKLMLKTNGRVVRQDLEFQPKAV